MKVLKQLNPLIAQESYLIDTLKCKIIMTTCNYLFWNITTFKLTLAANIKWQSMLLSLYSKLLKTAVDSIYY